MGRRAVTVDSYCHRRLPGHGHSTSRARHMRASRSNMRGRELVIYRPGCLLVVGQRLAALAELPDLLVGQRLACLKAARPGLLGPGWVVRFLAYHFSFGWWLALSRSPSRAMVAVLTASGLRGPRPLLRLRL
jgi:hypothetical protein